MYDANFNSTSPSHSAIQDTLSELISLKEELDALVERCDDFIRDVSVELSHPHFLFTAALLTSHLLHPARNSHNSRIQQKQQASAGIGPG